MKELEKILNELNGKNINLGDLEIIQEINYQSYCMEITLEEEEKELLFNRIHTAWLKSEDLAIHTITTAALENLENLKDMSTRELVEESCWLA